MCMCIAHKILNEIVIISNRLLASVNPASEAGFVAEKHHFMPYFVCRCAGQTGVTGDKGQTGDKGTTGDAGEFVKTSSILGLRY